MSGRDERPKPKLEKDIENLSPLEQLTQARFWLEQRRQAVQDKRLQAVYSYFLENVINPLIREFTPLPRFFLQNWLNEIELERQETE